MVFSSTIFLFLFLPAVLAINFCLPLFLRNFFLLIASLFFYAWGEEKMVLLMLGTTLVNFLAGLLIALTRTTAWSRVVLGAAIAFNLSFLLWYKYLDFFISAIPGLYELTDMKTEGISLPLGISFYTFHGISYLVDVWRKSLSGERNPVDLGLYIAFFPQLVAGPIVRYSDIASQLHERNAGVTMVYEGIFRFIAGLAKKVVIANTAGLVADRVFALDPGDVPASMAWLGIICYTLQIYFDFSGYSDMAIGLASMFGFSFKENFNYPYSAASIQDFWRRWHISLSTWFRDYLYIPLGGNQRGTARTYVNLFIVFFITGLWHGASWTFVLWGLFHGLFLILERSKIINTDRIPRIIRHAYVLFIVMMGWVLFRAESLHYAYTFYGSLIGITKGTDYTALITFNYYSLTVFIIAVVFSFPTWQWITSRLNFPRHLAITEVARCAFWITVFLWSVDELSLGTYNPFIYFRF